MRFTVLSACTSVIALAAASGAMAQEGEAIVVTGQRAAIERAIEIKRESLAIMDVAAADEIGRLPDRNVAEVVERLPGVGVTYDQGEGRYVAIRGVPSELNGYTLNGIELGNPDGQTRALPLDVVSGQLLNRVEVVKAKTAEYDGQGIGGSINLVTQTAFDFRNRVNFLVNAQVGHQELNDKTPVRGDAMFATRFGSDEQFGITLGGSYSERTFTSYGFYPDDWRAVEDAPRGGLPTNIKFTDYSLKRERIGATGSLDFRPDDDNSFYLRAIFSKFTEDEYRQRYRLDFATNALLPNLSYNADGLSGTVTGTPNTGTGNGTGPERRQDLRLEYKEKSILAGMAGGESRLSDVVTLEYALGVVHNEVREPNQLWQFRCNPGTVDFDFTDTLYTAAPRTECADTQMNFRQYTEQNESGDEDIVQARADLTWELPGIGTDSFLKFGAKFRGTDKTFDSANDVWSRGSGSANRFTLAQFDLAGAPVNSYPDNSTRVYLVSPTIDADKITAFTAANLAGNYFVQDTATTLANATLNDFYIDENVWAAYAMANLSFGAITVTPGLRFERTTSAITGFRLEDGSDVVPATGTRSYDDWLPSVVLRAEPSDGLIFRLAWSRALGRPNYSQLSPGGALSYEDGTVAGTFEGSFSSGNAALDPYRADNFDATAEWYFAPGSLLSVGAFAKMIDNPVFTQTQTLTDVDFAGRRFSQLTISQPLNAESGEIRGVEAAFQHQFTFLPGLLSGFGIELTGALVDSELELPSGRVSTFPQQSDFLYGAQLFYQKGIVEASIGFHNTGRSLLVAGATADEDQFNDDLRRLDAKISLQLLPGLTVFAEGQNLTDEPTRQYQAGIRDWVIQNERYGRTFWAGISARLK